MPKGQPNKRYTPEFKIKVVETMQKESLGYREAARQFDKPHHTMVARWERIYLEEGAEGLQLKHRGHKPTGRPAKLKTEVEEDLIAEVQRLRAENAYLKKLLQKFPSTLTLFSTPTKAASTSTSNTSVCSVARVSGKACRERETVWIIPALETSSVCLRISCCICMCSQALSYSSTNFTNISNGLSSIQHRHKAA